MKHLTSELDPQKEYEFLRQAALKYMEFQHTILNILLTACAAFLGFGFSNRNTILFFIVPPLGMFLAIIYKNYAYQIQHIANYIKNKYEFEGSPYHWETYVHRSPIRKISIDNFFLKFGTSGLFVASALLSFVLGIVNYKGSITEDILVVIDLLSIVNLLFIFIYFTMRRTFKNISLNNS
jgi:hypothetical protein